MPCKECLREYENRPNALCPNVNHWTAYAQALEAASTQLLENLIKCHRYCNKRATKCCADATSDTYYTCDEHAKTGGMDGDEEPAALKWDAAASELEKLLATR